MNAAIQEMVELIRKSLEVQQQIASRLARMEELAELARPYPEPTMSEKMAPTVAPIASQVSAKPTEKPSTPKRAAARDH